MKPSLARTLLAGLVMLCSTALGKDYTIAVIPKGTTHEFWKSVHAGAMKAEAELNAKGIKTKVFWKGPLREDDRDQQIQTVENFATRGVSGIVLAPLDSQALVNPVASAVQAGIPVVVFDSDLKSDQQVSFVATDNCKGGQMAGDFLAQQLGGIGNVILLRYAVGSASTEAREAGFLDALKKHPTIKLISADQYAGPTRETSYQAAQNLLNRFGNDANGIFCPNENSTIGMTKALRDLGKAGGKVKMVGFDAGSQSVLDLKDGSLALRQHLHRLLKAYPVTSHADPARARVQVILTGDKTGKGAFVEEYPSELVSRDSNDYSQEDPPGSQPWSW